MKYAIVDASGLVRKSGVCQDDAADKIPLKPGQQLIRDVSEVFDHQSRRVYYVDGAFEDRGPTIIPDYAALRRGSYPSKGDQLDMLWHAMDIGQIPKAQQFYNTIKAVKDKYPKP